MDRNDVFKRYSICERLDFERSETYIVYDNLFERNKRLTFLTQENLKKANLKNILNLYFLFSNQNIKSMEYLFEWGELSDKSYYFIRDARSLMKIKQHSFLIEDLKLLILDILIALYGIHRNGLYYGKIHENSIYYCFNRYDKHRNIHYVLSALPDNMKYREEQISLAQKWDIMSLGTAILKLLSKDDSDAFVIEDNNRNLMEKLSEYNIDSRTGEIIIDLIESRYDIVHYIKKILSNSELDKYPRLRSVYNEFLLSRFPKKNVIPDSFEKLWDTGKWLYIIEGSEGSGKTELLRLQSHELSKKGHSVLKIESLSETNTKISIYNNMLSFIRLFINNSRTHEAEGSPGLSEHDLLYALSLMKDRIKPVLMIDDLEYAEGDIYNLISMFIQSSIPVYVSQRDIAGKSRIHELAKKMENTDIQYISVQPWARNQVKDLLSIAFPFYKEDVLAFMLNKLCGYNIDKPKDIMRIVFQVNTYSGLDEIETGKLLRIITGIISKNLGSKPYPGDLSDIQKEILILLFLYPSDLKRLSDIVPLDPKEEFSFIEPLLKEGYIYEKNGVFSVNREIIGNNLVLDENPEYIQKIHKKIADFLILEAKKTKKYTPLVIAEHLFNSGSKREAAPFYLNAAINFEKKYNFDMAVKYYNIALSVYRRYKKEFSLEKQKKIHISLFDLYMKRGNLSNALQSLKNMQRVLPRDFEYYKRYSLYYRKKGDYRKAIAYVNKAAELLGRQNDKKKRLDIQTDLINILIEVGKFEKAYRLINDSLSFQKENGILDNRGYLLNLLGVVYLQFGSYDKAEKCLAEASEIEKNTKNYLVLPLIFNNLGIIYLAKGDFARSLSFYKRGLEICLRVNDIIGISRAYHNIGVLHKNSGQLNDAENYLMKSKIYHERANLTYGYSKDLQQLGHLYTLKGELNRAFSLLKESMRSSDKLYDKDSTAETLEYLGILYFFLGSYQESLQSLKEAKEKAMKTRNITLIISINMHLALIYLDLGDFSASGKHAGLALDEMKKTSIETSMSINESILDLCRKYMIYKSEGAGTADFKELSPEPVKRAIEREESPIQRFRLTKIYLDYLLSVHYFPAKSENICYKVPREIREAITALVDIMIDLNITESSRYYSLYCAFYQYLVSIEINGDDRFIANILKKSIESLDACINKDYSELIWRWEFMTALCYDKFTNPHKAKEHYQNTCDRLRSNSEGLSEPYDRLYAEVPFRDHICKISEARSGPKEQGL